IGADIGGIPELIENGKTGDLFESGNKEELKDKILSLWNDKERQVSYEKAARQLAFDSVKEYCEKLIELYKK
ncbi:MAG: glycosyltransferase, partial [Eubacterium sp.]|nr:glycosyltransferase [Eubacterium sp.]